MSAVSEVQVPVAVAPVSGAAMAGHGPARPVTIARLRLLLAGVAGVLALAALLAVATGASVGTWNPVIAVVFETATAVALGSIAAMSWVRYHEHGPVRVLFQCAAFLTLFMGSVMALSVFVALPARIPKSWLDGWEAVPWLAAGALVLLGTRASTEQPKVQRVPAWFVAVGPALGVLAAGVAIAALLAASSSAEAVISLGGPATLISGVEPGVDPVHSAVHLAAMVLLLIAASRYERLYAASPHTSRACFAMGLVWAAGGQLFGAIVPVHLPLEVTVADLCTALFIACSMVGVIAASQSNLRSLRVAYDTIRAAREDEMRRAAFEERARLARDIHDHLIQSLWLARLRQGHVLASDLAPDSRALAEEVCRALDDGLADAREAMVALDPGPDGPRPIDAVLRDGVARLVERLDLDLRTFRSGVMPTLDPTVSTQLLGIVREAVTNSAKHADATTVRIRLTGGARELVVSISDNGNGFDPRAVSHGYGLLSMNRRAEAIRATLSVESRPMDGTQVTVVVPLDGGSTG